MVPAARTLYASTQRLLDLPDYLQVWPGHGAGSACGKALGAVPETTVGYERRFSPAIAAAKQGEAAFVDFILKGQPEPPPYFERMKRLNRDGPPVLNGLPKPSRVSPERLSDLAGLDDVAVLDARSDRRAFYAGHLPGSIHAPLNKSFHGFVGSYFDPEIPVYLITEEDQIEELVRNLVRIGIDDIRGYFTPESLLNYQAGGGELMTTEVIGFGDVRERLGKDGTTVLDVRRATEHEQGHVPGAVNIAHTRLMPRLDEVPEGDTLLVHCQSGNRASAAVSFLERKGFRVVAIDDSFENWEAEAPQVPARAVAQS
jgi:hydroxyacylglutathione hydrolase